MDGRVSTALSLLAVALSAAAFVRSGKGPAAPADAPVALAENAEGAENAEAVVAENAEGAHVYGGGGGDEAEVGRHGGRESPAPTMARLSGHFAAAWYAAKAGNAPLVGYELHEMEEAVEALEGSRIRGVDLGAVAHQKLDNNIGNMRRAMEQGEWENFDRAYRTTLDACNSCHQAQGVGFIQIVVPDQPPAGNRRWSPGS